uniref:Uncharacterized protein n=1 Tax=viral metagenome TaxID=1070528 RepID=A0A6C0H5P5_9ZZZZ
MSNISIIDGTKPIDPTLISFKKAPKPFNGSYVINVNYKNKSLTLKTPEMFTWGIQEEVDVNKIPNGKFMLQLQFSDSPSDDEKTFFDNLKLLRELSVNYLVQSTGKSKDVIEEKFNQFIRYKKIPNTTEYNYDSCPTLKTKIRDNKNNIGTYIIDIFLNNDKTVLYGKNKTEIHPKDIVPKYSKVKTLIQCGGIWDVNKTYSLTFNQVQIAITEMGNTQIQGQYLLGDEDDETKINEDSDYEDNNSEYKSIDIINDKKPLESAKTTNDEPASVPVPVEPVPVQEPVVEVEATPAPVKKLPKKIIKK